MIVYEHTFALVFLIDMRFFSFCMMKFVRRIFILTAACCSLFPLTVSAQQQLVWTVPPNRVNFNTIPSGTSTIPSSVASTYRVANGAYDDSGNLLFYVQDLNVYKGNGTLLGSLTYFSNSTADCGMNNAFNIVQKEIAIVPVQGSCSKYYIIWVASSFCSSGFPVRSATIDISGAGSLTNNQATNSYIDFLNGNKYCGLAIGKLQSDGSRRLYVVANAMYNMYTVTATGITKFFASPQTLATSYNHYPSDVEISQDGTKLAWGSVETPSVAHVILNANGTIPTANLKITTLTNINRIPGVEFNAAGTTLYFNAEGGTAQKGIKSLANPGTITSFTNFINDNTINLSQLELARDGFLYAVNTSGKLVAINTALATATVAYNTITLYSNGAVQYDNMYSLPDQVDGESYMNFVGVVPATFTSLSIYNNTTLVSPTSGIYNVFNCQPITLSPVSANATQYKLTVYSSDVSGNQILGSGQLNYAGVWTTAAYPTALDLRTLSSSFIQTNTGYYKVTLDLKDACNAAITQTAILNVSTMSAATSGFSFNYGDGTLIPIPPGQTYLNPISTGQAFVGVNATASSGYLDYYQILIQKLDAITGDITENVCNPSTAVTIPSHSSSSLGSISLNSIIKNKCGGPFYYLTLSGNTDQVYRVQFTVGNICGTSSTTGYILNNDPLNRIAAFQDTPQDAYHSAIFPNPTQNQVSLSFELSNAESVNLVLTDSKGEPVLTVLKNTPFSAGSHVQQLDLSALPEGIYFYQLSASKIVTGKIIKGK